VANGDLYKVYCHIRNLLCHQLHEYDAKFAKQIMQLNHHLNVLFYAPLIGHVSVFALNKLASELTRSREKEGSYKDTPISTPDTPIFSRDTPRHVPPCIDKKNIVTRT
jgi:hypothetical protein